MWFSLHLVRMVTLLIEMNRLHQLPRLDTAYQTPVARLKTTAKTIAKATVDAAAMHQQLSTFTHS